MNFESLILSHHFRSNVTCECTKQEINDDDDDGLVNIGRELLGFIQNLAVMSSL